MVMPPVFSENTFQVAFDRGSHAAAESFATLSRTAAAIPHQWPGTKEEAALLIADLLPADCSEATRRLMMVTAYCGARFEWRQQLVSQLRRSGIMRRAGLVAPRRIAVNDSN